MQLAQKDAKAALTRFDRALSHRSNYAPALAGKAEALVALNRESEAIDAIQAALTADPSLTDLTRRIEVLRFRDVQRDVTAARQAARSGKTDEALARVSSGDRPFAGHRISVSGTRRASSASAATRMPRWPISARPSRSMPTDAASLVQVAEILDARNDFDAALKAYADALALEPNERVEAKRNALMTRAETARLPADYRAIEAAAQITRGDLAALIGVRLAALLQVTRPRDVGVMTDIRGHWAESWILAVTRAGVLDPFANHTFQPRTIVRRVDFAQAIDAAARESRGGRAGAGKSLGECARAVHRYRRRPSGLSGGVDRDRGRRDGGRAGRRVSAVAAVTGAEAIEALENLRAMARLVRRRRPDDDDRADRRESADAAADHADSRLRDPRDLRLSRMGADRVCDRRVSPMRSTDSSRAGRGRRARSARGSIRWPTNCSR